ncbi:hypothetical protein JXA63_00985 [Candidatus Woesebacteria bacterium]|nr:hypothetical protein [Candidatus Woesebacteria bacterium]
MTSKTGTVFISPPDEDDLQEKEELEGSDGGELDNLARKARWIIFECSSKSSFLSASKDRLTICPNRVTITKKSLFTMDEYPMPIENVTSARVYSHFRNASLIIETFGVPTPDPVKNLDVNDARLARRYIQALVQCKKNNIDLTHLSLEELKNKLKRIGMVQYSTEEKDYHKI